MQPIMKSEKSINDPKTERPRRAMISEKEAVKLMSSSLSERSNSLPVLERQGSRCTFLIGPTAIYSLV